ncbi:MAG TPA: CerR family C-terminal domain-containing protein [Stellaceae bacterium]|nr:CerR family C-terminal domain-containing protein [Stellaceae bacterium]
MKIIEAALRVFGEHGYEGASTRQIAQDAGVNPPALQYYFESKAGLHLACTEHIAERLSQSLEAAYAAADNIGPTDPEGAADALCGILDAFMDFLFGSAEMNGWSRFLARGQGEERGPAYDALRRQVSDRLHASCVRLVGLATGRSPADPRTKLRTIALLGQLSVFHLGRNNALAMLGWPDFRGERLAMLQGLLHAQTRAILHPISALDIPDRV